MLLQHAYSELTHDTVYKGKKVLPSEVHRIVARSMALIEAADGCFTAVNEKVESIMHEEDSFRKDLERLYRDMTSVPAAQDKQLFSTVLEALGDIAHVTGAEVRAFLQKKVFVGDRIKERIEREALFRQPIVLLLYYLVEHSRHLLLARWPLLRAQLAGVYQDLGVAISDE